MLRRAFLFAALLSLGCSSSDFDVKAANDAASIETSSDSSVAESGDVAVGPCDPEDGKAKYCLTLKLAKPEHPPYTAPSGASALGIDGKGRVYIALYDTDLSKLAPDAPQPEPKLVIPYPSETGEIDVDTELPVTVPGESPPGTYTIIAVFADNLSATRPRSGSVAGDFVVLPNVVDKKLAYPTMRLESGKVQKKTLELRPNRLVTVTMGFSEKILSLAATNSTMHGDGPTMFGLFDGAFDNTTSFLHLDVSKCVATNLQRVPTAPTVGFTTTVEGNHNVFIALFDWASGPTFPGKGTLTSTLSAPYPEIDIRPDMWTATKSVDFALVPLGPVTDTAAIDPLTCK